MFVIVHLHRELGSAQPTSPSAKGVRCGTTITIIYGHDFF